MTKSFNYFFSKVIQIIKVYSGIIILFSFFRIGQILYFKAKENAVIEINDLLLSLWTGFKFDSVIATYSLVFILVISLPSLFLNYGNKLGKIVTSICKYYSLSIFFIIYLLCITDFFYYKFFHAHFDNTFFGIYQDDTKAVLKSVWTDYPVILILVVSGIVFYLLRIIISKLFDESYTFPGKRISLKAIFTLAFIAAYFLGARGSVGTFPIGKNDMIVCESTLLNDATPNSVFYLKETIADRANYKINPDLGLPLNKYHFNTPAEAILEYTDTTCISDIFSCLTKKTAESKALETDPPNVIVILMESLGSHYFDLHSENLNLMGEFEDVLPNCIVFQKFLPYGNGTVQSFEGLLINTPTGPIGQSQYNGISFNSSMVLPYYKNGYETSFITGGKLGWRNMGSFTKRQFFTTIEGYESLLNAGEGPRKNTWGIFDEFLFDRIFEKMKEDYVKGKSSFIFSLTTTNHTPFELPETYTPKKVLLSEEILSKIKTSEDIAVKNFTSYQYSMDALGKFIKQVLDSEFGQNTIIAVTGDHNCRQLFEYSENDILHHYGVPLILYIPEKLRNNILIDTNRVGSHKDIMPTLYNISLSNAEYFNTGNNLLSKDTSQYYYGINNFNLGIDKYGAVFLNSNLRYRWNDDRHTFGKMSNPETLDRLYNKIRSFNCCMDVTIRTQLTASAQNNKDR